MSSFLITCWSFLRAFLLIYLCLWLGNVGASHFPTVPGSVLGMVILFILLATQIIPVHWVQLGCEVLIRYMALLFVPICVGIMSHYTLLKTQFFPLVIACTFSTFITLFVVAVAGNILAKYRTRSKKGTS